MSEATQTPTDVQDQDAELQAAVLEDLKARADKLGVKYHPSIGLDKLREKIREHLEAQETTPSEENQAPESDHARRLRVRRHAEELVRIQITCMNPNKREWEGEVFCAGNAITGTHKKYVPFDTEWHVPRIIYNMIKQRQFQTFVTRKDERGRTVKEGKLIREFNVVELPPLTEKELQELKQRQAMAAGQAH